MRAAIKAAPSVGSLDAIIGNSVEGHRDPSRPWLLAPCDLQAVKASGVTFIASLLERVIEERAKGNPSLADGVRREIQAIIGPDLAGVRPGSAEAARVKDVLVARGMWSQYLEVGIGPDAELFSKCPPMAAVGTGARVGVHPASVWSNPEPELVLVDELAHTNVPGSRHAKRWQDVELLRDEGISVVSAVNVQHFESLNNIIAETLGVTVRETIPDWVVTDADQVVNLDISAEDLRQRLVEGKIYAADKVPGALANFFTEENLTTLRELALREVASNVDRLRESITRGDADVEAGRGRNRAERPGRPSGSTSREAG